MKIAFIGTEGIPGNYGGFETFVDNLSYRLTEQGHEVTIFQPYDHRVNLNDTKHESVKIVYVKCPKNKYLRAIIKRLDALRKIKPHDFDFIHNFGQYPFIFNLFNKKGITVDTLDGFEWKREGYNRLLRIYLKKHFFSAATFPNICIVDSLVVQNFFKQNLIKTSFLPYGTNFIEKPDELFLKFTRLGLKRKNFIYFVGRFVPEKNIERLIEDFLNTNVNKKLVIIGSGNSGEKYEEHLKKISINDDRIIFTGNLYGEDYHNIISNALGYVSTSLLEGTSPALLDALGAKNKVLVSNIPENRATLNDLGYYYPLESKEESVKILTRFMNDELYSEKDYSELMNFSYQTYGWDGVVERYLNILRSFKQ